MTQAASAWPPSQDQFTLLDRGFGLRPWLEAQHSRDLLHRGRQQIVHIGRAQHATLQTLAMRRQRPQIKINRTRESAQQHICYVMRRCPSSSQRRRFCRTNSARQLPVSHTSGCKLRPVRSQRRSDRPPPSLTASPAFHLKEEEQQNHAGPSPKRRRLLMAVMKGEASTSQPPLPRVTAALRRAESDLSNYRWNARTHTRVDVSNLRPHH